MAKHGLLGLFLLGTTAFGGEKSLTYVFDSLALTEPAHQKRLVCEIFKEKVKVETTLYGTTLRKESAVMMDDASWKNLQNLIEEVVRVPLTSVEGPERHFDAKIYVTDLTSQEVAPLEETANRYVAFRSTEALGRLEKILYHACQMAGFSGTMKEIFGSSPN